MKTYYLGLAAILALLASSTSSRKDLSTFLSSNIHPKRHISFSFPDPDSIIHSTVFITSTTTVLRSPSPTPASYALNDAHDADLSTSTVTTTTHIPSTYTSTVWKYTPTTAPYPITNSSSTQYNNGSRQTVTLRVNQTMTRTIWVTLGSASTAPGVSLMPANMSMPLPTTVHTNTSTPATSFLTQVHTTINASALLADFDANSAPVVFVSSGGIVSTASESSSAASLYFITVLVTGTMRAPVVTPFMAPV